MERLCLASKSSINSSTESQSWGQRIIATVARFLSSVRKKRDGCIELPVQIFYGPHTLLLLLVLRAE